MAVIEYAVVIGKEQSHPLTLTLIRKGRLILTSKGLKTLNEPEKRYRLEYKSVVKIS